MAESIIALFIPILGIIMGNGMIILIAYFYFRSRTRERTALIEHGADPSLFARKRQDRGQSLKLGLVLLGLAFGFVMGYLLDENTEMDTFPAYTSMVFLFSGTALFIHHFVEKKSKEVED